MAMLSRFFPNRKISRNASCKWTCGDQHTQFLSPQYNADNIRLILFRDHGNDQRILMFDSKVEKVLHPEKPDPKKRTRIFSMGPASKPPPNPDPGGSTPKHQPMQQSSEHVLFGEMMFGSVPMSYRKGAKSSLKVHSTRSPPQLLMTQVFMLNKPSVRDSSEQESFDSYSITSSSGENTTPKSIHSNTPQSPSIAQSVPMDVPLSPPSRFLETEDSGISGSMASNSYSNSLPPSPSSSSINSSSYNMNSSSYNMSSSSYNSLKRRFERNRTTSLEHLRKSRLDDAIDSTPARKRPPKFGMCVVFGLPEDGTESSRHFQTFFFSHIMLLESHMHKLRAGVERAVLSRNRSVISESLDVFRGSFVDLYTAPRLSRPVWLNMMCFTTQRVALCQDFLKEFMSLVDKHETKSNKFFMSNLITAVLTNHLAWVPTVTPTGVTPSRTYLDKHSAKWLDTLAKTHPYNPLWAQLGDLYGAVGFPLRLARTVVIGKKADLVCKLLYVLSYFMRCSEVLETDELPDNEANDVVLEAIVKNKVGMEPILELSRNNSSANMEGFTYTPSTLCDEETMILCDEETKTEDRVEVKEEEEISPAVIQSKVMKFFRVIDPTTAQRIQDEADAMSNVLLRHPHEEEISKPRRVMNRLLGRQSDMIEMPDLNAIEASMSHIKLKCNDSDGFCEVQKQRTDDIINAIGDFQGGHLDADGCKSAIENMRVIADGISWSRTNSMFDEYFTDNSDDAVQTRSSLYKRFASIEGSSSIFDEYLNTPNPDFENCDIQGCEDDDEDVGEGEEEAVAGSPLNIDSQHFPPEEASVNLPDSTSKDLVTSTLTLMQDVMEDESLENSTSTLEGRGSASILTRHPSFGSQGHNFNRQSSSQSQGLPARCRSITPTELGRRRHQSQTSLGPESESEPFYHLSEIPLPCSELHEDGGNHVAFERNLGRSLMAAYTDHYLSDFVLHGTSDTQFMAKVHTDLTMAVQNPVLDEPIAEAVCIVADSDKWTVKQVSCQYSSSDRVTHQELSASNMVGSIVESIHDLWRLKMSPEFCLMHLEDRLQEIYFKSRSLAEYIRAHKRIDQKDLSTTLGVDTSDIPLLLAVAGTHSPNLALGLL